MIKIVQTESACNSAAAWLTIVLLRAPMLCNFTA